MNNLKNNDFHPNNQTDSENGALPWVWGGTISALTLAFLAAMLMI